MTTIVSHNEAFRSAIQWVFEERASNPSTPLQRLIEQACLRFDLTPEEAEVLERKVRKE